MKTVLALVLALLVLGGGYYYLSMQEPATPTAIDDTAMLQNTQPVPGPLPTTSTSTPTAPAIKEITITNSGMVFSEKELTVKKGDRVKITYQNGGGTHDFRIDGYNVGTKVLKAGESETIEFVADNPGIFEFYCSVGNHRAMGMKGNFNVTQ